MGPIVRPPPPHISLSGTQIWRWGGGGRGQGVGVVERRGDAAVRRGSRGGTVSLVGGLMPRWRWHPQSRLEFGGGGISHHRP
jgi:hypothetical protein